MFTAEFANKITIRSFVCSECYRKFYTLLMRILPIRHAFQSESDHAFDCEFCHNETVGCSEVTIDPTDVPNILQNIKFAAISMKKHPEIENVLLQYQIFISRILKRFGDTTKLPILHQLMLKTNPYFQQALTL